MSSSISFQDMRAPATTATITVDASRFAGPVIQVIMRMSPAMRGEDVEAVEGAGAGIANAGAPNLSLHLKRVGGRRDRGRARRR